MKMIRIGLSACFLHADPMRPIFKGKTLVYAEKSMVDWLMVSEEVLPIFLFPDAKSPEKWIEQIDGLVLQGGADMAPESYGTKALKPEWSGDRVRDIYEIELIQSCLKKGLPILGVCRGLQVINVAFGGTLLQDIKTQRPHCLTHRDWEIYDQLFHQVTIVENSWLSALYPEVNSPVLTNSVHHQAIDRLASDFIVEAYSTEDSIIEAIKYKSDRFFIYGVQWHPEYQNPMNKNFLNPNLLLKEFINVVKKNT